MPKFLTVCLNPVIQKTLLFNTLELTEVNRSEEYYTDSSGKGVNVTRVLKQLDADATHLTHAGGNQKRQFLQLLKKENIKCIAVNSMSAIRSCYTLLDKKNNTTTEIVEESRPVSWNCERKLKKKFSHIISKYDYLIISGSKAPGYSNEIVPFMVMCAKASGVVVILDLKGPDLINSLKYKPDYIKHNLNEYIESFGIDKNMSSVAEELSLNGTILVVTDNINPVKFWNDSRLEELDIYNSNHPVNTTGCGDAFTAGFAYGLLCKMSIKDAVKKGISCGSMNAGYIRPGVIKEEI